MTKSKNGMVTMRIAQLGTFTLPVVVIKSTFTSLAPVRYLLTFTPVNSYIIRCIGGKIKYSLLLLGIYLSLNMAYPWYPYHFWIFYRFTEFRESHAGKTQLFSWSIIVEPHVDAHVRFHTVTRN